MRRPLGWRPEQPRAALLAAEELLAADAPGQDSPYARALAEARREIGGGPPSG